MDIHTLELLLAGTTGVMVGTVVMMVNYGALSRRLGTEGDEIISQRGLTAQLEAPIIQTQIEMEV